MESWSSDVEMCCGFSPFLGIAVEETAENIRAGRHPKYFPKGIGNDCRNLMKRLMKRSPQSRIGATNGNGGAQIASFFCGN